MAAITSYASSLWQNRTVGLLGGSFNPAHEGHRHVSLYALKMLKLDAVWWLISPQNPLKSKKDMAPFNKRVKSAQHIARHPKIIVTDIEAQLGTRYTVDTIKQLQRHFPRTRFVWLMGSDNIHQFHKWKSWQEIFKLLPVCVFDRPPAGSSVRASKARERFRNYLTPAPLSKTKLPALKILHIPLNDVSATEIRAKQRSRTR